MVAAEVQDRSCTWPPVVVLLLIFPSLAAGVVRPLELPVVIRRIPEPSGVLPSAVIDGGKAAADEALCWSMPEDAGVDRIPGNALLCRISPRLEPGKAMDLAAAIRSARPDVIPVVPAAKPFLFHRVPPGVLLEPLAGEGEGWLLYRHYLVSTQSVRFMVAELTEAEILLGAAAGFLPEGFREGERQKDLARLYGLLWSGGGYRRRKTGGGTLLLLPPFEDIDAGNAGFLGGFHRAVLEAGFAPRILHAGEVTPVDVARYRTVLVPDGSLLTATMAKALDEAVSDGGVIVLGRGVRGRLAALAGVGEGAEAQSTFLRFSRTTPALPEVGADGLSRASRTLQAVDSQLFLGSRQAPLITVKSPGSGYVFVLNVDFARYRRLSEVGLSGAAQIRETLRSALGRAGVERLAESLQKEKPGFMGLRGPVPAGKIEEDWYNLVFLWAGGGDTRPPLAFTRNILRRVYRGSSVAVEGAFHRRLEWLTASAQRTGDGAVVIELKAGGVEDMKALPLLIENTVPAAKGAGGLRCVLYSAPVRVDAASGSGRFLIEDLLFSFRALAVVR